MYLGFEYEDNVKLKQNAPYKTLIAISTNWVDGEDVGLYNKPGSGVKAIVDGEHVEFVTQPIESKEDLQKQVKTLAAWGDKLNEQINDFDANKQPKDRKVKGILQQAQNTQHAIDANEGNADLSVYTATHPDIAKGEFAEVQHTLSLPLGEVYKIFGQWSNLKLSCERSPFARVFDITDASHNKETIIFRPNGVNADVQRQLQFVQPRDLVEEQMTVIKTAYRDSLNTSNQMGIHNFRQQSLGQSRGSTPESEELTDSGFGEYEGIAYLVAEYLNRMAWVQSTNVSIDYHKAIFPVLARTRFDSMLNSMGQHSLAWFDRTHPLEQLVNNWAKAFVKLNNAIITEMKNNNPTKAWAKHIDPDNDQLKNGKSWQDIRGTMKTLRSDNTPAGLNLSVEQWLAGLQNNLNRQDLISSVHNNTLDSSSMGELDMCRYIQQPMVILESRLAIKVNVQNWEKHATRVYEKLMT